jgi:NitT/TauT family transport system ATP-binding protein
MVSPEVNPSKILPSKLVLEHVSKWFQTSSLKVHALDDVTLHIAEGEFVCLVGPSGCGKSTLLNIIAGLERPDLGLVQADGKTIVGPGPRRLMMFQEAALFPWLTVLGNVLFGLKLNTGLSAAERREKAEYFLELVGLKKFMHSNVPPPSS